MINQDKYSYELQLLTVAEAAAALRVSKSLMYSLVESGRLSACRLGKGRGAIRILHEDLMLYVESNRIQVGGAAVQRPRRREKLKHIKL